MKKFFFLVLVFFALAIPALSFAALASSPDQVGLCDTAQSANLGNNDITVFVGNIIKAVLSILGAIILIFILYGGYLWLASGGNEQMITKAKGILINAAIGLIIVLAAYSITTFIMQGITGAISSDSTSQNITCLNQDNTRKPDGSLCRIDGVEGSCDLGTCYRNG